MTVEHSPKKCPLVVFDCNIFLQSVVRDTGPSFACLAAAEAGFVRLILSPSIIAEVESVLNRDKLQNKFPKLSPNLIEAFLSHLVTFAIVKKKVPLVFSYPRDPKDEPYINLAIAGKAEYIVSRDKDLLDLMESREPESVSFREKYPTITIVTPVEFLNILRKNGEM